jgi:hypothetical protein
MMETVPVSEMFRLLIVFFEHYRLDKACHLKSAQSRDNLFNLTKVLFPSLVKKIKKILSSMTHQWGHTSPHRNKIEVHTE